MKYINPKHYDTLKPLYDEVYDEREKLKSDLQSTSQKLKECQDSLQRTIEQSATWEGLALERYVELTSKEQQLTSLREECETLRRGLIPPDVYNAMKQLAEAQQKIAAFENREAIYLSGVTEANKALAKDTQRIRELEQRETELVGALNLATEQVHRLHGEKYMANIPVAECRDVDCVRLRKVSEGRDKVSTRVPKDPAGESR